MGGTWILVGSGPTARRGWATARSLHPDARVAAVNGAPEICGVPDLYLAVERDATKFYRGSVRRCREAGVESWCSERVKSSPFLDDGWPEATLLDHTFGPAELGDLHRAAKRWKSVGGVRKFTSRRIDLTAGVYALWVLLETKRPDLVLVVGFDGYESPSKADVNERNGEAIGRLTEHYAATTVRWIGAPRNLNAGHPWRVMVSPASETAEVMPVGDYDEDIARRLLWPPGPTDQRGEDWLLVGTGPSARRGYAAVREAYPAALTFAVNAAHRLCPLPEAFALWEFDSLGDLRRPVDRMLDYGPTRVYTSPRIRRRLRMPPRVHEIKPSWGPQELRDLHERRTDPGFGPEGARLNCGLYALWVLCEVYRPRAVHVVGFDGYAIGDCYAEGLELLATPEGQKRERSLLARNRFMAEATARLTQHYSDVRFVWWGVPRHLTLEARVEVVPLEGDLAGEHVSLEELRGETPEPALTVEPEDTWAPPLWQDREAERQRAIGEVEAEVLDAAIDALDPFGEG